MRAAAAGDLDAFEVLVRTFQEPVWRFLRSMVRDAALAEDLAQETFLHAFDRLHTFRFQSRFSTWLLQIARNPPSMRCATAAVADKLHEALLLVEVMGFSCRETGRSTSASRTSVTRSSPACPRPSTRDRYPGGPIRPAEAAGV